MHRYRLKSIELKNSAKLPTLGMRQNASLPRMNSNSFVQVHKDDQYWVYLTTSFSCSPRLSPFPLLHHNQSLCLLNLLSLLLLSLHLQPGRHDTNADCEGITDILKTNPQCIYRQHHPQHIKEHQVYPKKEEVACVE